MVGIVMCSTLTDRNQNITLSKETLVRLVQSGFKINEISKQWIENFTIFHEVKQVIVKTKHPFVNIPPHLFYSLIMCAFASYYIFLLFSSRVLINMLCNFNVFHSIPWYVRIRNGIPYVSVLSKKHRKIVLALLLFSHCRYTINLLNPSIPSHIIKCHLISLWLVSKCQRWFGAVTL